MKNYIDLLYKLCTCIAPSGYEDSVRNSIVDAINNEHVEIQVDAIGNLIISLRGNTTNAKNIALLAHMDSASLIIEGCRNNAFYLGSLSSWKKKNLNRESITFLSGNQAEVFCNDDHYDKNRFEIMVKDKKKEELQVGDVGTLTPRFGFENDKICGTFLDDRVGCLCLIKIINELNNSENNLYFIFTAQEEIGNKGAKSIQKHYDFDEAIVIDTTVCNEDNSSQKVFINFDAGPTCKLCDGSGLCSNSVFKELVSIAETRKIKFQKEILTYAGSDILAFSENGSNCKFGAVSIPCKYMHSSHEEISFEDLNGAHNLIRAYLEAKNAKFLY